MEKADDKVCFFIIFSFVGLYQQDRAANGNRAKRGDWQRLHFGNAKGKLAVEQSETFSSYDVAGSLLY
ncbi:MAG: hypothetical protein J6S14_21285 [Clostridia bacterium]|nr:hypothetical protein [Clostridia bacterium]